MLKLLSFYNHESAKLAWQLSFRRCLNFASADPKKSGKQNVFYFEESNLLPADKTSSSYSKLYKEIPVVAVLGWAGAQDQNVQKYSQIYSSLGYHIIRFSPSHSLTFLGTKKHETFAVEFLELFKTKHNLTENKIFLHMFSNASFFIVYHHLIGLCNFDFSRSGLIRKQENDFFRKNQAGVIYDSALGLPANNLQFIHAVADLVGKKNSLLKRYLIAGVLAAANRIYFILFRNNYFSKLLFSTILDSYTADRRFKEIVS